MLLAIHYLRCVTVLALLSVLVACEQKSTAMPDTQARALLLELAQRATDQIQSDQNGVGMATGELTLTEDPDTQANRSSTRSYLCTLWFDPKMYRADWFDPKVPSKRLHCYATGKDLAFQYDETRQILGISDSQYANQGRLGYDGRVMTYQGPQGYHVSNLLGRLAQTKADLTVTLTTTSQGQIIDIQTRITDQTTGLLREKGHYQVLDTTDGNLLLYREEHQSQFKGSSQYLTSLRQNQWAKFNNQWYISDALAQSKVPHRRDGNFHLRIAHLKIKSFSSQTPNANLFTRKGMTISEKAKVIDHVTGTITQTGKPSQIMSQ